MESPGKCLKKERESRNLNLEEVSQSTRIKEPILRAIEEDRYDRCPPSFYVKGFLTNYARYLGIDPKDIILKYQELNKASAPPMKTVLSEQPRESLRFRPRIQTRVRARVLLLSVLLISLVIPLYIYHGYVYQPLKAPDLPVLSRQKLPTSAATPEKENPPVI
ncbi:MAG TPA: helix-turn-helix domain-containing protein, partial [Thermodesulfobacteriota bacterium]|nr:helix-turn-helix domain-containing protein [Thermodesulfobacteriota bacterium]